MILNRILLLAGALTLAVSGSARSNDTGGGPSRGPCVKAITAFPNPAGCEYDCYFVCWDRFVDVTVTPGVCMREDNVICTYFLDRFAKQMYRDCDCPFTGGLCWDAGIKPSGTQDKLNCK